MAKSFAFPLQKVLDMRKHTEEQKALELSKAQKELLEEKKKLLSLKEKKEKALESAAVSGSVKVTDLKISKDYIMQINDSMAQQNQRVKKSDQKVSVQREKLLAAVKDKKVVETLKEKQRDEFRRLRNLTELKQIDDVALRTVQRMKEE